MLLQPVLGIRARRRNRSALLLNRLHRKLHQRSGNPLPPQAVVHKRPLNAIDLRFYLRKQNFCDSLAGFVLQINFIAWRWAALRPESKSVIVASSLSNICFFHYIRTRRCSQPLLKNPSDLLWLRIGIRRTGKKDADIQINRRYRESLCRKSHLFQAKFTNHIFCLRKFFCGPYFSGITGI